MQVIPSGGYSYITYRILKPDTTQDTSTTIPQQLIANNCLPDV